jgi:hypothetical protein
MRSGSVSVGAAYVAMLVLAAWTLGSVGAPAAFGAIVMSEVCDNCVDDDANMMTDRDDPMCMAPADGGFAGLGDASEAKAAVKCQKAIEKASTKFLLKKLKRLEKCVDPAFACVQLKHADQACLDKAKVRCDKQVAGIAPDEMKAEAAIEKACGDGAGKGISVADARDATGLGFSAEEVPQEPACNTTFSSFSDIATCVVDRHECGAERLLVAAVPRAAEMLRAIDHDPTIPFPCLAIADLSQGADGGGDGILDAKRAKAAVKCQVALEKAGLKLATAGFKAVQKCADAAATCIQKPDAAARDACRAKVAPKCQAASAKFKGPKGPPAKLLIATLKKCETADVGLTEVGDASGLGLSAASTRCAQFTDLEPSTPVGTLIECVGAQYACDGAYMLEREAPRLQEYAGFLGLPLSAFGF